MKKFVLTILALTIAVGPAFAQGGDISAYNDQTGTSCNILDQGAALHDVFILLKHTLGANALKFKVATTGVAMSYVSETVVLGLSIGNTTAGIEVAFPQCQVGDVYFMKITYFGTGTSPQCSYISVVPHPTSEIPGEVIMVDCAQPFGTIWPIAGGQAIVNPGPPPVNCDCNVAAGETTWGGIKALYR